VKATGEEVVRAFNQDQILWFWCRRNQRFQFVSRTELIARSADKQLGFRALLQELEVVRSRHFTPGDHRTNWRANADYRLNACVSACGAQSNRRSEGESRKQQRQVILGIEPIERSADIFDFAIAVVVFALAQSGSPKVEAQHREAEVVDRFHGVEDDLVVQRSAEQWMRMTDQRRVRRVISSGVEQGFETSRGTVEEE